MSQPNEFLGTTIITARAARRWTQQDLADRLGVQRQSVAKWEGGWQPSDANLAKLRELLGPDIWKVPEHPPQRIAPTDVKGARYAAILMNETVGAILRECARVEDLAEREADERAKAIHTAETSRRRQQEQAPPKRRARG